MKKIDKAIMLIRSIPEEKLDAVINFLIAFSIPAKQSPSKPGDIIDFSTKLPDDSRE